VVTVVFSAAQSRSTGGETEIEIDAGRVDHLIRALCERYAALEGHLEHAAVSVDGVLHNDAMYVNLPDGAEVQFIGAVAGGSGDSVGETLPGPRRAAMPGQAADPIGCARTWCEAGRPVAIATVVETWGSSP